MANVGDMHRPRHGSLALRQPVFDWKAPDRNIELLNFEMEVTNILQTRAYELNDVERVPIIKGWLGRERLQFIQIFTNF